MRSFVGAFDAIDKPKYALRQPFEPQNQGYPLVFSAPGAHVLNKVKTKQMKHNSLIHNYFVEKQPVYPGVASKGLTSTQNTGFLTPNGDICRLL